VIVKIDEPGSDIKTAGIDVDTGGTTGKMSHRGDITPSDRHVGPDAGVARAIKQYAIAKYDIEGWVLPRTGARHADEQ
jgi:hypothetical protein